MFVNNTGYVYKFSDVYTYDGTPINSYWESCIYDGRAKNIRENTLNIFILVDGEVEMLNLLLLLIRKALNVYLL